MPQIEQTLERAVMPHVVATLQANAVDWKPAPDHGWRGLEHMRETSRIRRDWEALWPSGVAGPRWDAVGRVQIGDAGSWEWVLLTVFSQIDELLGPDAVSAIEQSFSESGRNASPRDIEIILGRVHDGQSRARSTGRDWALLPFAVTSRLALRAYLSSAGVCGRMILCVPTGAEWDEPLRSLLDDLAIRPGTGLSNRVSWVRV